MMQATEYGMRNNAPIALSQSVASSFTLIWNPLSNHLMRVRTIEIRPYGAEITSKIAFS